MGKNIQVNMKKGISTNPEDSNLAQRLVGDLHPHLTEESREGFLLLYLGR